MSSVFIDANVPMYASGRAHPLQEPAQRAITALATGDLDGVTDAEVFQEILYRYFRAIRSPRSSPLTAGSTR